MIFECSFYNCGLFINFFETVFAAKKKKNIVACLFLKLKVRVAKQRQRIYIRKENFIVDILNKIVFFVMFSSYIIKELKNLVLCR